jgi:homoserine O-acetyltransferase/O-succinyltransferase
VNWENESGSFALGDFAVEKGGVIRNAHLAWQRFGTLNAKRDNLILYPSSYSARLADLSWQVSAEGILDPTRWCIVAVGMFSNGESSGAAETPDYPALVTVADNVRAQHRLVTEMLGVDKLAAVYGFSMGGMQAYHWAALYPDMVPRAFVVCGSARTADHNKVFLSGLMRTLEAAPEHIGNGRFSSEPVLALKAFGHIYAGWGLSQDFYRAGLYKSALARPRNLRPRQLGRAVFALPRGKPLCAGARLVSRRYQRECALRRRSRASAPFHQGASTADAERNRSLFPRRR